LFIILVLTILPFISADCLFSTYQINDSHIGECDFFPNNIEMDGSAKIIQGDCQPDENCLFSMDKFNNSHIGECGYFDISLCSDDLICSFETVCTKTPLVSVYQNNDTHVGSANYFDNILCCRKVDETPSTGGGGGSSPDTLADLLGLTLSPIVCEKTYESALTNDYDKIENIRDIIEFETGELPKWTDIRDYIDNWQPLCSDLVNLTLQPSLVCKKIFFFIVENNYQYDSSDLSSLKDELKSDIEVSLNLLQYYIDNHFERCYSRGLSDKLPNKPGSVLSRNIRNFFDFNECDVLTGNSFFDLSIPFFKQKLGSDFSCLKIETLRLVMSMEVDEDMNYFVNGIKLWWILTIIVLIGLVYFIKGVKN